jgi:hypothetical protein
MFGHIFEAMQYHLLNSQVLTPWVLVLSVVGSLVRALIAAGQWQD